MGYNPEKYRSLVDGCLFTGESPGLLRLEADKQFRAFLLYSFYIKKIR